MSKIPPALMKHLMTLGLTLGAMLPASAGLPPNFLDNSPLSALTDIDRQLQRDAALYVLESQDGHATREWRNPQTGFSGRIEGQGNLVSAEGLRCRNCICSQKAQGLRSSFAFPVCKDTGGNWFIASGMKLAAE